VGNKIRTDEAPEARQATAVARYAADLLALEIPPAHDGGQGTFTAPQFGEQEF